tara:strand:- start:158 stop:304 length:147 start_codon:yes stop_codon:yes gene_type:complete
MNEYQTGLAPSIKIVILVFAIVGPLAIAAIIFQLRQIEKQSPERIRWK